MLIEILPKVGPLRVLNFTVPGMDAENFFIKSFDTASAHYSDHIAHLQNNNIDLNNIDLDTGENTAPTEYRLADKTYSEWLLKLREKNFKLIVPAIKQNILNFYGDSKASLPVSQKLKQALGELNAATMYINNKR